LNHASSPLCISCFSVRVLCFFPGLALVYDPPSYAYNIAGTTDVYHHTWLFLLRWSLLTFCLGWPQTIIVLVSASQVPEITGTYHHTWLSGFGFCLIMVLVFVCLSWKCIGSCQMLFQYQLRWSCDSLLYSNNIVCYTDWFSHMFNHHFVYGVNLTWLWYIIHLIYYWIWFSGVLLRNFAFICIRDINL
jgi:hypothetical protein